MPDFDALLKPRPFPDDDGSVPSELASAFGLPIAKRAEGIVVALHRVILPVLPHEHPGLDADGRVKEHAPQSTHLLEAGGQLLTEQLSANHSAVVVFSGIEALNAWNNKARPVPVSIDSVAVGCLKQHNGLIVLDPGSEHEMWLGRTAVIALATGGSWLPPWGDGQIKERLAFLAEENAELVRRIDIGPTQRGVSAIDIVFAQGATIDDAKRIATRIGRELESNPYVSARLDLVEIRPRLEMNVGKLTT
ncbi:SseB family protein [Arcanobacterium buesumense]|uniref:SseB family protein n=1 Tax=Arcanobacterium buesumense TaxID=2722751 RepID=A0A6H2ELG8_9ACTO|nr:SseB family protein [Arcanobacterium buesumense]QJC21872.1 SseB family protein [Arcanobacterium buesumense]